MANRWEVSGFNPSTPRTGYCDSSLIVLGGSGITISPGFMRRTYINLAPHDILYVTIQFLLSGTWQSSDWFYIDIDGVSSRKWSLGPQITTIHNKQCLGVPSLLKFVIGKVFHTASHVTLTVYFSVKQGASSGIPSIGLHDVAIISKYRQEGDAQGFNLNIADSTLPDGTECDENQYSLGPNLGCTSCSSTFCDICTGIKSVECYRPGWGTYYNSAGRFSSCYPKCAFCTGPEPNACLQCLTSYVLDYKTHTCQQQQQQQQQQCVAPYKVVGSAIQKCLLKCDTSQYLYWNNTCRDTCAFPLQTDVVYGTQQCAFPCNTAYSEFLFRDGSCSSTCPATFFQRNEDGYRFCDTCLPDYYYYPDDGSCALECIYPYIITDKIYCRLDLSPDDLKTAQTMAATADLAGQTSSICSTILGFLNPSDPSAFGTSSLTKMLFYTRYMRLRYSPTLQKVLDEQKISKPSVGFLCQAQDLLKQHVTDLSLPGKFDHYKLHSSFLVNFFQPMLLLLLVLAIIFILYLIIWACKPGNILRKISEKARDTLQWNFLISYFMSHYDEVILYSSLEIRLAGSNLDLLLDILSFLASLMMLIVILCISVITILMIRSLRRHISNTEGVLRAQKTLDFKHRYRQYQITYDAFRDSHFTQQSFFFIFTARLIIFHIIIAGPIDHPFVQAILIMIMSIFMLLYLCIRYPIKSKPKLAQYIVQEVILLVVNTCVLTTASLDRAGAEAIATRRIMGGIFLYCNFILTFLVPAIMVLLAVSKLVTMIKRRTNADKTADMNAHNNVLIVYPPRNPQVETSFSTAIHNNSSIKLVKAEKSHVQADGSSFQSSNISFSADTKERGNSWA